MKVIKNTYDRISKLKLWSFGMVIIISIFFSNQDLTYPHYIKISKTMAYIPFLSIALIFLISNKRYYIDLISVLLFARLVIYIIPLIYIENVGSYWGNYFPVIASFFTYLIFSQKHNKDISKRINKLVAIFLTIISLQTIHLFFIIRGQYGSLSTGLAKYYMVTPIGSSNYIASIILPLLVFVYYADINRKIKSRAIILGIISLLIIQSKNAIFVLTIVFFLRAFNIYLVKVRSIKDKTNIGKPILLFTFILSIILIGGFYFITRYVLTTWSMGMQYDKSSLYQTVNALTSNRLVVYSNEISRWLEHMLFGNGLSYNIGQSRSHNWIIELLVQSGVIGFLVFITAIILWIKKVNKYKKTNLLIKSSFYSIIIILFQGLAEVSMFTVSMDILFWFIIGISVSEANRMKRQPR